MNIDVPLAKQGHLDFFLSYIKNKIQGKTSDRFFYDFLEKDNNLEDLIIGKPKKLEELNSEFEKIIQNEFTQKKFDSYINKSKSKRESDKSNIAIFFAELETIFNYDILKNDNHYNSYTLTKNLDIRTCVYCNRTYTLTKRKKTGGRLMNPQLDHWFPQSRYPLLQISFYNLIPSCEICNSRVKNSTPFNLKDDCHPYQDDDSKISFNYRFSANENEYSIYFTDDSDPKKKNTCEKMFIDRMYEAHQSELLDLIQLEKAYSKNYLSTLKSTFPNANLSDKDIYRLATGVELDPKNFHKRPFSKFKYDILKDLKII